jgi:uroporphyrin-III C-methyltransferase
MPANVNWQAVAAASPVLVMYMAVKNLGDIAAALMAAGRPPAEPVTIVSNASLPHQLVQATTLAEAGTFIAANEPPTPAIVVVGHAADWRDMLDWYKGALRENPIG